MAHLSQPQVVRRVGPDGKRCKADTPGARQRVEESNTWYAKGSPLPPGKK